MDFHAHLDRHEVIGLLAGSWSSEQRLLRVERAFPVREAAGGGAGTNDGTNVEMDPEDQLKVRILNTKHSRVSAHMLYVARELLLV